MPSICTDIGLPAYCFRNAKKKNEFTFVPRLSGNIEALVTFNV